MFWLYNCYIGCCKRDQKNLNLSRYGILLLSLSFVQPRLWTTLMSHLLVPTMVFLSVSFKKLNKLLCCGTHFFTTYWPRGLIGRQIGQCCVWFDSLATGSLPWIASAVHQTIRISASTRHHHTIVFAAVRYNSFIQKCCFCFEWIDVRQCLRRQLY